MKKIFLLICLFAIFGVSKELSIKSKDGFVLKAWLKYPKVKENKYSLAVIAHQFGSSHLKWKEFARELRKRGFVTLNLDLRGHGKSVYQNEKLNQVVRFKSFNNLKSAIAKSSKYVGFKHISQDIIAWIGYIEDKYKNIDTDDLAFFGASLGGGALIGVMFDYEPKIGVFFSPGSVKEAGGEESISDVTTPIMFVSSSKDFALKKTIKYMKEANIPTMLILPGSGHGEALLKNSKNYVNDFLDKYLNKRLR